MMDIDHKKTIKAIIKKCKHTPGMHINKIKFDGLYDLKTDKDAFLVETCKFVGIEPTENKGK